MIRNGFYILLLGGGLAVGFAVGHRRDLPAKSSARQILYYQDPMHPAYRSDKPGIAPDCGMQLVPVYAAEAGRVLVPNAASAPEAALIDPAMQRLYGIKLARAERDAGKGTIQAFARVEPDETRIYHVNFGTEGYVKETQNDAIGDYVTKNQHLAIVYSPDFLALAGGYLAAHASLPSASYGQSGNFVANASQEAASVEARADRLRNLGMSDTQIDEITRTRKLPENIYVVSPTDGFILARNISPGQRFERAADLYQIADLSHVWIIAEVYGRDAQVFRPGGEALVTLPDSGESFPAKVSNVLPEVDPATRVLKVRLEVDNPGYKLRPDMFVSVSMPVSLPSGISVPSSAILDAGLSRRVFVQTADGAFVPREVETGWQLGDRVQIVKGLLAGETVVASGTFLVDSESKLQSTAAAAIKETDARNPGQRMRSAVN